MNDLNPGIAATVAWLNANGFKTTDSGDGETHDHPCDLPMPYVHMVVVAGWRMIAETHRLEGLLRARGVQTGPMNEEGTAPNITATYSPGEPAVITLWNVRL